MQTIILIAGSVALGMDAGRQPCTKCLIHGHTEVWPSGAVATIAAKPANVPDWCPGCERQAAQAHNERQVSA